MYNYPTIERWGLEGKLLTECTKEELIQCIKTIGYVWAERYSHEGIRANALGKVEMLKRGER